MCSVLELVPSGSGRRPASLAVDLEFVILDITSVLHADQSLTHTHTHAYIHVTPIGGTKYEQL